MIRFFVCSMKPSSSMARLHFFGNKPVIRFYDTIFIMSIISWLILIGSILAISIGDVFIKKAGASVQSFGAIFKNPWFIAAALLYIVQVVGFGYLFFSGAKLSWIAVVQTVLYALVVIGSGVLIFHGSISLAQGIGIALAVVGLILVNL